MQADLYNIGQASNLTGISAKMIRHYEEVSLIPRASRTLSGYRIYNQHNIQTLLFIRHSRDLGFSIKEIANLLSLWTDKSRLSRDVKKLSIKHIAELDQKLHLLNTMKSELLLLVDCCHGDERPECPILEELARA